MENKEQDFINRYKNVQESIVKAMDKALERAIGNKVIDFEKCEGNYLSNSEILCKGCNKSERETNDNIMVVRIDKMDDVYRNDRPLDPEIGVVHSFRINNKIIKAVACQTVIRNDICSKCCFVDTNICSNMRCFSSVREDDKSVIFKKIEL